MKNNTSSKIFAASNVVIKGIPIIFLGLFALCIFLKSKLLLTPVTLVSLSVVLGIVFISRYKQEKWIAWLIAIFLTAFVARIIFIILWPITPLSDCEMAYKFSEQLNAAAISRWHELFAANKYYYDVWPMHVPFVIFQTLCIRFLGNGILSIQVVNMFFSALTCVFVAICAEGLSKSKRVGIIAGLLMTFNITTLFMAGFLVNQHISTCFFMASMCFIIKRPFKAETVNYVFAGILLAVGHLMRPEMYIVVIAVLCMFIYEIMKGLSQKEKLKIKSIINIIAKAVCFVLTFLLVINIANSILLGLRWVDNPITASKLEYKFMIGLNQETEGRFQDSDYPLAANDMAVKEVLKERISGPLDTAKLMIKKLCFQFSSYNYWWLQADKGGRSRQFIINNIFEPLTQGYMFLIIGLSFIASIKMIKNTDKRLSLLYIIYIGFLCAFALMEVQQRYAYITIPIVTVWASMLFKSNTARTREEGKTTHETTYERGI